MCSPSDENDLVGLHFVSFGEQQDFIIAAMAPVQK